MPLPTRSTARSRLPAIIALLAAAIWLAGCSIAPPRTDDPWESVNRKTYAFNQAVDEAFIRPVAVGYRKITNDPVRDAISDFFTNLRMPITIGNDLLQGHPERALTATGRFLVNLTIGLGGFLDPASRMGIPFHETDFGVTLARWGVPSGPYLVLPLLGPTNPRAIWKIPVDGYFLDPLAYYERAHRLRWHAELLPQFLYLVSLRASVLDADKFLKSAFDPYAFRRDAWQQRRLYKIYYGQPPIEVIEKMQGLDDNSFDPMKLLQEQKAWEQEHDSGSSATPPKGTTQSG